MTGPPEVPDGTITVATGQPLSLGDIRRFVALMDAAGADDQAAVMAVVAPRVRSPWPEAPAGLTEITVIGGYPRTGRGRRPTRAARLARVPGRTRPVRK